MKSRSHVFFTYFSAWILISVFYAVLLWVAYDIDFLWAVADSMISTTLLFIIGLALYFMIQYEDHMRFSNARSVFQLIFGYLVAVSLFYIISDPLLQSLAESNNDYQSLYEVSRIPRMIVSAMLLLLMLLTFRLYKNLQMLREKTEQGMRLQSLLQESELNALRWQINPHFLFNSLNSVSSLTIGNPQQAREMIIKLSELLRYSLRKSNEQFSTLEQEINHIRLYTDIEKVRFGDRLNVAIDAKEQCLHMKMPFLILQPLIENAVKHGVYSTDQKCTIQVHCECSSTFLMIQIENSYDPEGRTRTGTGTGLSNTAGRIRLMYNDDSLFRTSDSGSVFRVTLKIPQV